MFIQQWEAQEERLKLARQAIAHLDNYPRRIAPVRTQQPLADFVREGRRGVYELEFAPPGRRAFHIVASNGDVGYVDFPAHWASRDLVKNLWRRLDRDDPPRPQLHVIHASSSDER